MDWFTIEEMCAKTGCRNKRLPEQLGCSIECNGWILNANKCTNLFCANYTNGRVCHVCYIKNKGITSCCLTYRCKTPTLDIFCETCSSRYYGKTKKCQNPGCTNKTSLKYCEPCYVRHKSGKTPLHKCINKDCVNDTYIHLKYCTSCHSRHKMLTSTYNDCNFKLTICL